MCLEYKNNEKLNAIFDSENIKPQSRYGVKCYQYTRPDLILKI